MDKPKVTPKDFFLWAGAMVALYVSTGSLVALLFEYIERIWGDAAIFGYDPYASGLRFAIANLIVIFPVFIYFTRVLNQDIRKNPEKKELWVRKWLVFGAVFVAGVAMLIDLIVLINIFLSGEELTAAFLLKVLTILVVFGGIFYYYLNDLKGTWEANEARSKMIGAIVVALVAIAIIAGFFVMGSPQTQRELRQDRERISDLESIQWQLTDYYQNKQELPEALEDLKDPLTGVFVPSDPRTGDDYEYTKVSNEKFEICATFAQSLPTIDEENTVDRSNWRTRDLLEEAEQWPHEAGRTCFDREVDPDNYPSPKEVFIR